MSGGIINMRVIYYFSGTGNSLSVAKEIADSLTNTDLVRIDFTKLQKRVSIESYEQIGIVFPVYSYHMPKLVVEFLKTLQFNSNQYVFGIATCGAVAGEALKDLRNLIRGQGGELAAEFKMNLPGNCIIEYTAYPNIIQKRLIQKQEVSVNKIIEAVEHNKKTLKINASLFAKVFSKTAEKRYQSYSETAKHFCITSGCTQCGTCQKVCPANNIMIHNGSPSWGKNCEACMACIQWCPARAIQYGKKTIARTRYHHPKVTLGQMKF